MKEVLKNSERNDDTSEFRVDPTGSGRLGLWRSSGLVDEQHPEEAGPRKTFERG